MPENEVLQEILKEARKASGGVQDLRVEVGRVAERLEAHQEQDRGSFSQLNRSHAIQGSALGALRQQVGHLQGHKEAAKSEGAKAGRRSGAGWAAVVAGIVALAQQVWAYFSVSH